MDPRRRFKYKLARISEGEEEEEIDEETKMMDDGDEDQGPDVTMSDPMPDPPADPTPEGRPHDSPTPESHSNTAVPHSEADEDITGANNDADEDVPASPPPVYQDPPSYNEAVNTSSLSVGKRGSRDQDAAAAGGDDDDDDDDDKDLEWDKDQSVEPSVRVNPLQESEGARHRCREDDIEMQEISGAPGTFREQMEVESQTPTNHSSCFEGFNLSINFKAGSSRKLLLIGFSVLVAVAAMLIVILVPLTFSYVEYYELGLKKQRSTGAVYFSEATFESGRYAVGPDFMFKKYPSMGTTVRLTNIDVTTTAGLAHRFSCSFQYFIREGELGLLEQRFDKGYADVIEYVGQAALKNAASQVSLDMYLDKRRKVELKFHDALREKLGGNCCPDRERCIKEDSCHLCSNSTTDCDQGYHVDVPLFQLLGISLPSVILDKNLQVQVMIEEAEMETFVQQATLTRKETERITEEILNAASEVTNNATISADLILSIGEAEAWAMVEAANSKGLALLYDRMRVTIDDHKASLHWLKMLEEHESLIVGISFEEYLKLINN